MGWFSSSPSSPTQPLLSDGSRAPPNRSSRAQCYAARDAFFGCLTQHGIIDSLNEASGEAQRAAKECGEQDVKLQRDCAASWATYFKQRRVMEWRKKETLEKLAKEGAQKVDMTNTPAPAGQK